MNKLNKKMEYALMALKYITRKSEGSLTTAKEVVTNTGVPFDATARVMQIMGQKGILRSEQGAQGGYQLVGDLSQVSFFDLIEMVLGPLGIVKCLHGSENCEIFGSCDIQQPINHLNNRLVEFYKGVSLQEILIAEKKSPLSEMKASAE